MAEETQYRWDFALSQAPGVGTGLKAESHSASVLPMRPSRAFGQPLYARQRQARIRRARQAGGLAILALLLLVTLFLTAFGSSPRPVEAQGPALAERLLPAGPPRPQVVALQGLLRLQLPIAEERVTAIAYHSAAGALALRPVGVRANQGLFTRLVRRVFGGGESGLRYYQLSGHEGPATGALAVGAAPGTDVYSPVDGTVVGISDYVLSGRRYGVRLELQPRDAPSVLVALTRLRPDPTLRIGSPVLAATSKVGSVLDLSAVERQELARFTQDAGNHVAIEVHQSATLTLP